MKYLIATIFLFITSTAIARDYYRILDVRPNYVYRQYDEPVTNCRDTYQREYYRRRGDSGDALIGGIIGGVLGSQIGSGSGRDAATVAGALLGASSARNRSYEHSRDYYRGSSCSTYYQRRSYREQDGYIVTVDYYGRPKDFITYRRPRGIWFREF